MMPVRDVRNVDLVALAEEVSKLPPERLEAQAGDVDQWYESLLALVEEQHRK